MTDDLRAIAERVKRECNAGLQSRLQLVDAERLADFALAVWEAINTDDYDDVRLSRIRRAIERAGL